MRYSRVVSGNFIYLGRVGYHAGLAADGKNLSADVSHLWIRSVIRTSLPDGRSLAGCRNLGDGQGFCTGFDFSPWYAGYGADFSGRISVWSVSAFFGICPWDYTGRPMNVNGLIRLDFAPLWFGTGLLFEWITKKNLENYGKNVRQIL